MVWYEFFWLLIWPSGGVMLKKQLVFEFHIILIFVSNWVTGGFSRTQLHGVNSLSQPFIKHMTYAPDMDTQIYHLMKNAAFWDVTPCGACKNRRFGRT
jgi:hypothetical protein